MTAKKREKSLESYLKEIAHEIREDKYMLMEYLGPVVNGCRAAFEVSVEQAKEFSKIPEEEFQKYIDKIGGSYQNITVCFFVTDTRDMLSLIFDEDSVSLRDECVDPDVVIRGRLATLKDILDSDSRQSPLDLLGEEIDVHADVAQNAVIGLGLLCFPSLLRMARSGIDPSSLLAEDADAVIMAAASDMVTKMVQKWIDIRIKQRLQDES